MHVAYYFIYQDIPCTKYAEEINKKDPLSYIYKPKEFRKFRLNHMRRFEMEICLKLNPFHKLTSHIINLREKTLLKNLNEAKQLLTGSSNSNGNDNIILSQRSNSNSTIDYNYMVLRFLHISVLTIKRRTSSPQCDDLPRKAINGKKISW